MAGVVARNQFGSVREVDETELAAGGYTPLSPDEAVAWHREQRYGGALGTAAALGTGALRGATLGVSDHVISALGGQEDLAGLRDANPGASTIGEVGGGLLGLGKAGAVRGVISAPARIAMRTGAAVERALPASPLIGSIARAAVEGGFYGGGVAVSEAALQNKALTAEQLTQHALQGMLLGGGVAGGIGAVGRGGARLVDRVRARVTGEGLERLTGEAFGTKIVGAWDKAASTLGGAPEGAVASMFKRGKNGRFGFEAAVGADDIIERSADGLTERLEKVLRTKGAIEERFRGALKEDQIARIVRRGNEAEIRASSEAILDSVASKLDDMVARDVEFGATGTLKTLRKKAAKVSKKLAAATDDQAPERAFMLLDSLKRDIGIATRAARKKAGKGSEFMASFGELESLYQGIRSHLELEPLWGAAATMQRRINAPWSEMIPTNKSFLRAFTKTQEGDWGVRWSEASRDKVAGFVGGLTNPKKSDSMQALTAQLDALKDFARAADEVMHLPDAERAAVRELEGHVSALRGYLDEATEAITARNQLRALEASGGSAAGALVAGGAILGGAPGAIAGKAFEVITRPGQTVRQLAALHSLLAKAEGRGSRALAAIADRPVAKASLIGQRVAVRTMQPDTRERFETTRASLRAAPPQMQHRAHEALGDLIMGAPATTQRAAEQAASATAYLASKVPLEGQLSPPEMRAFLETVDAAAEPALVLEDLAKGRVRPHQVQAVRDLYPEQWAEWRAGIVDQLSELDSQGQALPYAQRIAVGLAFDLPTDPMFEMLPMLQAGAPEPPPPVGMPPDQPRPDGPAPRRADSMRTGIEARAQE